MHDLTRLDEIEALSVPSQRVDLIRARHAIHANIELQKLFDQAEHEQWNSERLAHALDWELMVLGVDVASAVCRFLADEFHARDKTSTLLVSAETGLAVAQVPEDAIYVPEPVAREGTDSLATPLPRLKPELEAAIIRHRNVMAEEPLVIAKLQDRARSTALQRAEGDQRLRISTRSGRKKLSDRLREELPELIHDHSGSVGRLFQECRINSRVPRECETRVAVTLHGHSSILVADSLAMNFRYDAYRAAREKIRFSWAARLAKELSSIARRATSPEPVTVAKRFPTGLLIGTPDLVAAGHTLAVPLIDEYGLLVTVPLHLEIAEDAYAFEAYETEARWCVDASVKIVLRLDVRGLYPLLFTDLVESGLIVEVLS